MGLKSNTKNVNGALLVLVFLMFLVLATTPVRAFRLWAEPNQIVDGKEVNVEGSFHWDKGITIKVYIPKDPDGMKRDDEIKKAFDAWKARLDADTQANIKFEYHMGETAPANEDPKDHVIAVNWCESNTKGYCHNNAFYTPTAKKGVYTQGPNYRSNIDMARHASEDPRSRPWDVDQIYNTALHEIGHSLGLDHYTDEQAKEMDYGQGVMTSPAAEVGRTVFHEEDTKGIQAIYGAPTAGPPKGNVEQSVIPQGAYYIREYNVSWLSGTQISVFEITTDGVNIYDVHIPNGWLMANYSLGDGVLRFYGDADYINSTNPVGYFSFMTLTPPSLEIWWAGSFGEVGSSSVGGIVIPVGGISFSVTVDKPDLLAPYIGLASTAMIGAVATAVYVRRVKRRKEKQ